MAGLAEHADVGAGAEHPLLAGVEHHDPHLRVLEAQPLDGIVEFDVNAQIVGIQLQLVAVEQAAVLVDIHGQAGDRPGNGQLPVPVAVGVGAEIDHRSLVLMTAPAEAVHFSASMPAL